MPLVTQKERAAEHRLHDEPRRHVATEAKQQAGLDHRLGEERKVRRARPRQRRDRVHVVLRDTDDRAEVVERLGREVEIDVAGVGPAAEPGNPFVNESGRIRHRAHDTRLPGGKWASIEAVRIPAATERTVCSVVSTGEISARTAVMSCGFTETTTRPAPSTAARLSAVVVMP